MAPVRWATPGIYVPCTKCPAAIAAACSQEASTPPPSPPSAAIRSRMGLASAIVTPPAPAQSDADRRRSAAEQAHEPRRDRQLQPVPARRIADDVDLRKRGAELRRVRDLPAQAAADAVVVDVGDRIGAQRVLVRLEGERRAAGEADAGVVAGAHLRIDPEAGAHDALARRRLARHLRPDAALAGELALAVGDDHLEALVLGAHRLAQRAA